MKDTPSKGGEQVTRSDLKAQMDERNWKDKYEAELKRKKELEDLIKSLKEGLGDKVNSVNTYKEKLEKSEKETLDLKGKLTASQEAERSKEEISKEITNCSTRIN